MKKILRELLEGGRIGELAELAARRKSALGLLLPFSYTEDESAAWLVVTALGAAAERIADQNPEFVREFLRRLRWVMNEESGGFCPRAPEIMAEIIARRPSLFAEFIAPAVWLLKELEPEDLGRFKAGILWAVGRLGPVAAAEAADLRPSLRSALDDSDPQIRGLAAWALRRLGYTTDLAARPDLLSDHHHFVLYEEGRLSQPTVADMVQRAIPPP